MPEPKRRVAVFLSDEEHERLRQRAFAGGLSMSVLIRAGALMADTPCVCELLLEQRRRVRGTHHHNDCPYRD